MKYIKKRVRIKWYNINKRAWKRRIKNFNEYWKCGVQMGLIKDDDILKSMVYRNYELALKEIEVTIKLIRRNEYDRIRNC